MLSTRPTSILNREVGLRILMLLCVITLGKFSNKFHMITRAVAYTLLVRTSPHIGPRCGFHLLCEYFESRI